MLQDLLRNAFNMNQPNMQDNEQSNNPLQGTLQALLSGGGDTLLPYNSGESFSDTLAKSAIINNERRKREQEQYEFKLKQQQYLDKQNEKQNIKKQLPQLIRQLEGKDPKEIFATLIDVGVEPEQAGQIASYLSKNQEQKIGDNQFTGADSIRYETTRDANGNLIARPIPGQINKQRAELTPSELRINTMKLKELDNATSGAQQELRLIEDLEKSFKEFDKATGINSNVGAGSFVSKMTPKSLENVAWNEKAQSAKQEIAKVNSVLYQNRIKAAGGAGGNIPFQEEVKRGLPTIELQPEARNQLIETKKRETIASILRGKFFHEWSKNNHKDLSGAEDAFTSFVNTAPLLKENGEINRGLVNQIPKIVKEYFKEEGIESEQETNGIVPVFAPSDFDDVMSVEPDLSLFDNIPKEVLLAERKRREEERKRRQ